MIKTNPENVTASGCFILAIYTLGSGTDTNVLSTDHTEYHYKKEDLIPSLSTESKLFNTDDENFIIL